MNKFVTCFLIGVVLFGEAYNAYAQKIETGKRERGSESVAAALPVRSADKTTSVLVGPGFPPPLGVNWTHPGAPGAIGRLGGNNWWFSGVNLAASTPVYWGPQNGRVLLSLDGSSYSPSETLHYNVGLSNLANGVVVWNGGTQYFDKNLLGPFLISAYFTMTVTDSVTGAPIALTSPGTLGLPADVGGLVPVTPGLHFKVNLFFSVGGLVTPYLDFFDANNNAIGPRAFSSLDAGFYYTNVPPTVSSFADTVTNKDVAIGPIPFTVGDLEYPLALALNIFASSSDTTLIPNGNILFGGGGTSRNVSITPATGETGTSTITVFVSDGLDTTTDSFVLLVKLPVEFQASPTSINYGNVVINSGKPDSVTVNNPGTDTLHISSATSDNARFGVTPGSLNVPGGESRKFYITFTPNALGPQAGAVHFVHDGSTSPDSVTVSGTGVGNGLNASKMQDNDGSFATAGDRVAKGWYLEIHKDTVNGPLIASDNSGNVGATGLENGLYYVVEADSTNWVPMGAVVDAVPTASSEHYVAVALSGGNTSTVQLVNAPPAYGQTYRSLRMDSLAYDKDNAGKVGKPVKRKATRVRFKATLVNTAAGANGLHAEFGIGIDPAFAFYTVPTSTPTSLDPKLAKWEFTFSGALSVNDTVRIYGFGNKGKPQKISKYFWKVGVAQSGPNFKLPPIDPNELKDPMPNRVNILSETYALGGFLPTGGLLVGNVRSGTPDSSKQYGWVLHKKYGDVLKSLFSSKSVPQVHDGLARGFDFVKAKGNMPKTKHNNVLFANLIALKASITASALGITPPGLGELIYDDGGVNSLNGMMVKEIAHVGDSLIQGYYLVGVHLQWDPSEFNNLNVAVAKIDSAFEGPMDTVSFAGSLVTKGVRRLIDVPFLHADPSIVPERIKPVWTGLTDLPTAFELYQNYPNPFNPTTTIQFDLAEQSFVTLKVYNLLGQEVATLFDNQLMDDGFKEATFDASHVSSGVYFYRLIAQSVPDEDSGELPATTMVTKKMLLMK